LPPAWTSDVVSRGNHPIDVGDFDQSNATLGTDGESRRVISRIAAIDQFSGLGNTTDEAVIRMGQL
jgi:hypothetical protein